MKEIADKLEAGTSIEDLIFQLAIEHKRVIFNGNGYSEEWVAEAARRGLPSFSSCVDVYKTIVSQKSVDLFESHGIFKSSELKAR